MDQDVEGKKKPPVLPPGSAGWCNRRGSNRNKLERRKFLLKRRKNFAVRGPCTGAGCPEGCGVSFPGDRQNSQTQGWWTPSWVTCSRALCPFQAQPFWDSHAAEWADPRLLRIFSFLRFTNSAQRSQQTLRTSFLPV